MLFIIDVVYTDDEDIFIGTAPPEVNFHIDDY